MKGIKKLKETIPLVKEMVKYFICYLAWIMSGAAALVHESSHMIVDRIVAKPRESRIETRPFKYETSSLTGEMELSPVGKLLGKKLSYALLDLAGFAGETLSSLLFYFLGSYLGRKGRKSGRDWMYRMSLISNFGVILETIPATIIPYGDYKFFLLHTGIHPIFPTILFVTLYPSVVFYDVKRRRRKYGEKKIEALERLIEDEVVDKVKVDEFIQNYGITIGNKKIESLEDFKKLEGKMKRKGEIKKLKEMKIKLFGGYFSRNKNIEKIVREEVKLYDLLLKKYPKFVWKEKECVEELYKKLEFEVPYEREELSKRIRKFYEGKTSSAYKALKNFLPQE